MAVRKPLVSIGGVLHEMPVGDSVAVSYNGGTDPIIASFSGTVLVNVGTSRYYHPSTTNITGAYASLGAASSSGNVVAVIKLNGSTLATLTIPAGQNKISLQSIAQAITSGDYLTIDVTSAGSGATDLTVYVIVEATGGAAALIAKDEGSILSSAVTSIDFVGAGVTATNVGGDITVTIAGGGGGAYGNLDNGTATSTFGGVTPIDCGSATA